MYLIYDDLKRIAGGKNPAQVVANLQSMGIKFRLRPDGKPVSTLDALNAAIKINRTRKPDPEQQDIEI